MTKITTLRMYTLTNTLIGILSFDQLQKNKDHQTIFEFLLNN
jgi:hypothetical protein